MNLEKYFEPFRNNIVGINAEFKTPYGVKKLVYADWIASGRLYKPIEEKMLNLFGPMVGNTHSEASETGVTMTHVYQLAKTIIKNHVNASCDDVIITTGTGMTGAVSKLQRILGLKVPERASEFCEIHSKKSERPVVFITHLEHHSNHTSWLETVADVVILEPDDQLMVCPNTLRTELKKYLDRPLKIGSFSAGSNVTGIIPPYYELAEIMHEHGGYAFVDFAASAPYSVINMHPENPKHRLDAILFSPHKALGGPGSSGVLIFNKSLYKNRTPDNPGGGTVAWTNRWNEYAYINDIEAREDGGTPGFLQTVRVALALKLKEQMGMEKIKAREKELSKIAFTEFDKIENVHLLLGNGRERLSVFSFFVVGIHHNLIVKILNDRFGIQTRGGCSCAGTYGHYLLAVSKIQSDEIVKKITTGDLTDKPGWVRVSLHPIMTNDEVYFITDAVKQIVENIDSWRKDYYFDKTIGEFYYIDLPRRTPEDFESWFVL